MSIDRYTDNHTIKLSSGKTLTIDADNISFTGAIALGSTLGNTSINGTLSVTGTTTLSGSLVASGNITKAGTLTITATGSGNDITMTAADRVSISASSGDIDLTAASNLDIGCNVFDLDCDYIDIDGTSSTASSITLAGNLTTTITGALTFSATGQITLNGDTDGTNSSFQIGDAGLELSASIDNGASLPSSVAVFTNSSTSTNADVAQFTLGVTAPGINNVFCRFSSNGTTNRGRIRGSAAATDGAFITDGSSGDAAAYGVTPDLVEVDEAGDVVYASGGADYGEWIPVGDLSEWDIELSGQEEFLGVPEGFIVYVRDGKFYKEAPGTPMAVTYRSIVVGNEKEREDFVGQILSFIGQVPVMVKGAVNIGDFLIPSGSFWCTAISPDEVTFKDYLKVIGTAWESSEQEGLSKVNCSIGIKNIN